VADLDDEISEAIDESLRRFDYSAELAARGEPVVALNDDGDVVEYRTDGTVVRLRRSGDHPSD
jgi:hypothetical protein